MVRQQSPTNPNRETVPQCGSSTESYKFKQRDNVKVCSKENLGLQLKRRRTAAVLTIAISGDGGSPGVDAVLPQGFPGLPGLLASLQPLQLHLQRGRNLLLVNLHHLPPLLHHLVPARKGTLGFIIRRYRITQVSRPWNSKHCKTKNRFAIIC